MKNGQIRRALIVFCFVAIAVVASGCNPVDCSDINQPDMGGLVCVGRQYLAVVGTALLGIVGLLGAIANGGG